MTDDVAITTQGLSKHYGAVRAVDSLDLSVRRGEVYAFLGRNGAGKTTTIRMLLGLIRPTSGEARVLGETVKPGANRVFSRVGYLVETATAYPNLTVRENLEIQRRLVGGHGDTVPRCVRTLGLEEYVDRQARALSLGNLQRLALARALLHEPELVVLDEPANALDPAGIVEIRRLLRSLADEHGVTVFMSSHILGEVAHLADRVGIVHEGRLVEELDYEEIRLRSRSYIDAGVTDTSSARRVLAERLGITEVEEIRQDTLRIFDGLDRPAEMARAIVEAGIGLTRLVPASEDLEDHFLRITGGMPEEVAS